MRLVMADITKLPFHDASFDVVLAVHVFHLVDGWPQALKEVLRVLRPGGVFLHCWDEFETTEVSQVGEIFWEFVREAGGQVNRPGTTSVNEITSWLNTQGLNPQVLKGASWQISGTPRESIERITKRHWSSTWNVPEEIFSKAVERLWAWADERFGEKIDTPVSLTRHFMICRTQV